MNLLERLLANYIDPEEFLSVYDELQDLYKDQEYFADPEHKKQLDPEEAEFMEIDIQDDENKIAEYKTICNYGNMDITNDITIIREYVLAKNPDYIG